MRAAVLSIALIGCAYRPGSFSHPRQGFLGQRTTVGCLDLSVERRPDLTGGGTVLAYEFGNRCDHATTVDLASVVVVGRTYDGAERRLSPYDPRAEIRSLSIDGRTAGREAIAYPDATAHFAEVCVDAASLADQTPARWLCFAGRVPPQLAEVTP
ncbi:MAG: hypothetical protein HOV81_31660 [Kofleriaceae bacterium]|nr:hypothetical protein [Kofleriaceae bacterium]